MNRVFLTLISILILSTGLDASSSGSTLKELLFSLGAPLPDSVQIPDRLVPLASDLFEPSTGFRHEKIFGILANEQGSKLVPELWFTQAQAGLSRQTALETGLKAAEGLLIYTAPAFAQLSADLDEIVLTGLRVALAYRESGYDSRLLNSLYLSYQAVFFQTLPAFLMLSANQNPGLIQSKLLNEASTQPIPPAFNLAIINAQVYESLKTISEALVKERPKSLSGWLCLLRLARSRQDQAGLTQALKNLEKLDPRTPGYALELGESLLPTRAKEAEQFFERASKLDPRLTNKVEEIKNRHLLKLKLAASPNQLEPLKWEQLANELAQAGLIKELDKLLEEADSSLKSTPGWQRVNLKRQQENIFNEASRYLPMLAMQPASLPQIVKQCYQDIANWSYAARSADQIIPEESFSHLVGSGLLLSLIEILDQNQGQFWNEFKTILNSRPKTKLESSISSIILNRFPELKTLIESELIQTIFEQDQPRQQRVNATQELINFAKNLFNDLGKLNLSKLYPNSALVQISDRLIAILQELLNAKPEDLLELLDGSKPLFDESSSAGGILKGLRNGLTLLLSPVESQSVNREFEQVKKSLAPLLVVTEDLIKLAKPNYEGFFSLRLPTPVTENFKTLLQQHTFLPAALTWLKAASLISELQVSYEQEKCQLATALLLKALDELEKTPLPDKARILKLYNDQNQLAETILQNLGYCLAELRHPDAAAFTGSAFRKSKSPTERIIRLLDHRRVINNYLETPLVNELKQLLTMIKSQANFSADDKNASLWIILSWLKPLAGSQSEEVNDELKRLDLDDPIRPNTVSFGAGYSASEGFGFYAQILIQAYSTPETWLRRP